MSVTSRDVDDMARTIYGEARGESWLGQLAIAFVIINRATAGKSISEVCRAPKQFSCWNSGDPNRTKIDAAHLGDPAFRKAMAAACGVIEGLHDDPTNGAMHYHASGMQPYWAESKQPVCIIGAHQFYNDID